MSMWSAWAGRRTGPSRMTSTVSPTGVTRIRAPLAAPGPAARPARAAPGDAFAVDDQLGEGGFAVVFRATDRKLSRAIAVKVLRPELTASKASKARFVREAETAARLNHPHILPIFFVGEGQGLVYFGMPL